MNGQEWIDRLDLAEHPEGGYFRETYRSPLSIVSDSLEEGGDRSVSTAIYYLLLDDTPSHLHRLKYDELWHFYSGSPLTLHILDPHDKSYRTVHLGIDSLNSTEPQALISGGCWFGATVDQPSSFSLVGCTVAPGFDFADFELGVREELLREYPEHGDIITRLTRENS